MIRVYIIVVLYIVVIVLNCFNSESIEKKVTTECRKIMESVKDSVMASVAEDTSSVNPILRQLTTEYDWSKEQQKWQRNPFLPKVEQTKNETKVQKRIAKKKSPGLSLTGIIQKNNTRKALINGQLYEVGQTVQNIKILEIGENFVTIQNPKRTYKLFLDNK